MSSVRERLEALAAPLGTRLPEEYIACMANPPQRGIPIRHLCRAGDPSTLWRPAPLEYLEADIWRGKWKRTAPNAHGLREDARRFLDAGVDSVPGPAGSRFGTERLSRGFWIGEEDGDSVFLDAWTLGVFAYWMHENRVEQWAESFAAFAAGGQQMGHWISKA